MLWVQNDLFRIRLRLLWVPDLGPYATPIIISLFRNCKKISFCQPKRRIRQRQIHNTANKYSYSLYCIKNIQPTAGSGKIAEKLKPVQYTLYSIQSAECFDNFNSQSILCKEQNIILSIPIYLMSWPGSRKAEAPCRGYSEEP